MVFEPVPIPIPDASFGVGPGKSRLATNEFAGPLRAAGMDVDVTDTIKELKRAIDGSRLAKDPKGNPVSHRKGRSRTRAPRQDESLVARLSI